MLLPLSLKILGAAGVLLLILLIIWKSQRKFLGFLFIVVAGIGIWQGIKEYNRTNQSLNNVKADIKISAVDMIKEYENNDSASNKKYLGKIVEIDGVIKKLEKNEKGNITISVGDSSSLSSVRCSMDSAYQNDAANLSAGSSVSVRGNCTGFNKDEMGLGSDVILNRCVIISKEHE